ncbi:cysteine dioxygenase family protein [Streptomyces nondiastaticus]|uniref:Cysteine dioxygenase n=1 Tax=Streptomyces nondiastaticus TaxID=3154512 RepID=A0ABW6U0X3_9ACTN
MISPVTARMVDLISVLRDRIIDAELNGGVGREPWVAVEEPLQDFLRYPDLLTLEQEEPDPVRYRQHLLHADPDGRFSVVALVWMPGQATPVHDHVAWCVVGVYRGEEVEENFRVASDENGPHLVHTGVGVNGEGSVSSLYPPGDIHIVRNATSGKVISLHVYGADISARGSSIRRCYDMPIRPRS